MPDRARRLRQSIARFERLLSDTADITPELAETYRAEIAAAEAMLDEIEGGSPPAIMTTCILTMKLPAPDTTRWTARRKAAIVQAVRIGSLSLPEACRRYNLSIEEFRGWEHAIDRYGFASAQLKRGQPQKK